MSACRRCGECCERVGRPPFVPSSWDHGENKWLAENLDMPKNTPESLRREFETYMAAVFANRTVDRAGEGLPCFWWDAGTKSCKHYPYRPTICREYQCSDF